MIRVLSICSGTAMLDVGVHGSLKELGYEAQTIGYVEQDEFCQAIIKARIKDGLLPDGFIWPDLFTFAGARLRGHADAIVAGIPCQPYSHAGKGLGLKDERYLFGELIRVADEIGVSFLFLENVPGLLSPDTDVDDGTGEFIRYAPAGDVFRLLAESGFDARWTDMGAEDIGAPHGRHRWWCIAYRMADANDAKRR